MSFRLKMTLWMSGMLLTVMFAGFALICLISGAQIQREAQESLIAAVEDNFNEVRFHSTVQGAPVDEDASFALPVDGGLLEVDKDYLMLVNETACSLYRENGELLYGVGSPDENLPSELPFADRTIQVSSVQGHDHYVYDRRLNVGDLWIRGEVPKKAGAEQIFHDIKGVLVAAPFILAACVAGIWIISGRLLRPIAQISDMAEKIESGRDLGRRTEVAHGKDEIGRLAAAFDTMLDRLAESFDAQRRFIADTSHELRTPVSVIAVQCEYALESRADPSGCRDALAVVDRQNKRMSTLIEDMLILTRLDRSLEKRVFESVDLSVQVESVCADMAISAPAGITVQCDAEPNVVVSGDANLLHRLVANLVGNACKYGKDGGHVVVSLVAVAGDAESDSAHGEDTAAGAAVSPARLAGGVSPGGSTADGSTSSTTDPPSDHCGKRAEPHALLTVRDDGIGISEKDCRRIFDRFYQADSSRSNTGSGLGLSIVAEIARIHKGRVHVESVLGKGSSFSVVLPLARAREAP